MALVCRVKTTRFLRDTPAASRSSNGTALGLDKHPGGLGFEIEGMFKIGLMHKEVFGYCHESQCGLQS